MHRCPRAEPKAVASLRLIACGGKGSPLNSQHPATTTMQFESTHVLARSRVTFRFDGSDRKANLSDDQPSSQQAHSTPEMWLFAVRLYLHQAYCQFVWRQMSKSFYLSNIVLVHMGKGNSNQLRTIVMDTPFKASDPVVLIDRVQDFFPHIIAHTIKMTLVLQSRLRRWLGSATYTCAVRFVLLEE